MDRGLFQAAWNRDVDHLLKEIDTNPSLLHTMALEGGETPLHIACLAGHLNFAASLLKLRQEFSTELNQNGFSPLHLAASCGHVEIVKELLKIDLGLCMIQGKDRRIPLHLAVMKGKVVVVRELLLSNLDSVECARGETSLHLAVKNNRFKAFQVLIQHLNQVEKENLLNSKDFHGSTMLHLAVSMKQYEVVDFLLNGQVTMKEKMELSSLNKSGLTPLDMLYMFQSEAGDHEIGEILIRAGAMKAENLQSPHIQEERPMHENPRSPDRSLLNYFKYNINLKDSPSIVKLYLSRLQRINPHLVLEEVFGRKIIIRPQGNVNTLSSATNNTTATKPHTAGRAIMGTN